MTNKTTKRGSVPRGRASAAPTSRRRRRRSPIRGREEMGRYTARAMDRLRPRFDPRPKFSLAAGRPHQGGMRKDIHRANVRRGHRSAWPAGSAQLRPQRRHPMVWKLDRLARSMKQLIETVENLRVRGIGFRSLTKSIDTTTAQGVLVFHMFSALAEFERALIRERTRAGLAAARRVGRTGGRPRSLNGRRY